MKEDHLLNILKIISVDDYDEVIANRIYVYLESRKLLNLGYDPVRPLELAELDELLQNTQLIICDDLDYKYEKLE